jgi:hypothetical protein
MFYDLLLKQTDQGDETEGLEREGLQMEGLPVRNTLYAAQPRKCTLYNASTYS